MDIQGWLQGTTDRAPPDPPDGLAIEAPAFIRPATAERKYHRRRRRAASDSSIIAPQQRLRERGKADAHGALPGSHRHVNMPVSRPGLSVIRHDPRRSTAEAEGIGSHKQRSTKPYEKRARHKTKADRYELKARHTREKKQAKGQTCKPGRKRDRARHGGDGKRTEGLVQGFKLKNGPKNSRLTASIHVSREQGLI